MEALGTSKSSGRPRDLARDHRRVDHPPRVGLHLPMFFAQIVDAITVSWFPFNKNLSSKESILYFDDQLTITPSRWCSWWPYWW